MNQDILNKLTILKQKYISQGFIILGVFGSYARGEEKIDSDIDILYEVSDDFFENIKGWKIISVIEDIRNEVEINLGKKIDFTDLHALKRVGKKYILPEVRYV